MRRNTEKPWHRNCPALVKCPDFYISPCKHMLDCAIIISPVVSCGQSRKQNVNSVKDAFHAGILEVGHILYPRGEVFRRDGRSGSRRGNHESFKEKTGFDGTALWGPDRSGSGGEHRKAYGLALPLYLRQGSRGEDRPAPQRPDRQLRLPAPRWRATICFKGKRHYLDSYKNFDDAVLARKQAENQLHDRFLQEYAFGVDQESGDVSSSGI